MMRSTRTRPKTPGFYWFRHFNEPWTVLNVTQNGNYLHAVNEEYEFPINPGQLLNDELWSESKIEEPVNLPPTQYYPQLGEHYRNI